MRLFLCYMEFRAPAYGNNSRCFSDAQIIRVLTCRLRSVWGYFQLLCCAVGRHHVALQILHPTKYNDCIVLFPPLLFYICGKRILRSSCHPHLIYRFQPYDLNIWSNNSSQKNTSKSLDCGDTESMPGPLLLSRQQPPAPPPQQLEREATVLAALSHVLVPVKTMEEAVPWAP